MTASPRPLTSVDVAFLSRRVTVLTRAKAGDGVVSPDGALLREGKGLLLFVAKDLSRRL
jgi:hypothetical protein